MNSQAEKFPNGITSYLETHYELSTMVYNDLENESTTVYQREENQGTGGIWEYVEELTDQFEKASGNLGDGDFFDKIEDFYEKQRFVGG